MKPMKTFAIAHNYLPVTMPSWIPVLFPITLKLNNIGKDCTKIDGRLLDIGSGYQYCLEASGPILMGRKKAVA